MKKLAITTLVAVVLLASICFAKGNKATQHECMSKCERAVEMVKTKGLQATIDEVNDPAGSFLWKDTYVFAINYVKGTVVAHPLKPKLIGKSLSGAKDINGVMFFVNFMAIAEDGSGWVKYMWPKPNEKTPSEKRTYVLAVPNTDIAFLAGVYK